MVNFSRMCEQIAANAQANADLAKSKMDFSEKVTSDLSEEDEEVKQQFEEATSKAESLQSELLEINKTNILLKQKLMIMISQTRVFRNPQPRRQFKSRTK